MCLKFCNQNTQNCNVLNPGGFIAYGECFVGRHAVCLIKSVNAWKASISREFVIRAAAASSAAADKTQRTDNEKKHSYKKMRLRRVYC
jgi:hypothetical protein